MKKTKTLFDQEMERPSFREKYKEQEKALQLELQILDALEKKKLTYEAFAKMLGTKKSNISRDLKGKGLRSASLRRIEEMAEALGYDFLPLLVPKAKRDRKQMLSKLLQQA